MRRTVIAFLILSLASVGMAQTKYKKYSKTKFYEDLLVITLSDRTIAMSFHDTSEVDRLQFNASDIGKQADRVTIKGSPVVTGAGITYNDHNIDPAEIYKVDIQADEDGTTVSFKKKAGSSLMTADSKRNRIVFLDDIKIDPQQFVRGAAVSFWGNITVDGEVNEDVVAVFGDITIGDGAVIRGDVLAINGRIDVSGKATIYGEVQSSDLKKKYSYSRRRRWQRRDKYFETYGRFSYNRVDGATPYLGFRFIDEDSLLPQVKAYAGYAFASERARFYFGIEQSIFKKHLVSVGGEAYRKLGSDDEHIVSDVHNTIFALMATEDYHDFYEAEGLYFYTAIRPLYGLKIESGVRVEKYRMLDAHPELWSLFGGSKVFQTNFASLPDDIRAAGRAMVDGNEMVAAILNIEYQSANIDTRRRSSWTGLVNIEWVPNKANDDFSFARYWFSLNHSYKLNHQFGLLTEINVGASDKNLPIHRLYYLGGLNTLAGYDHKEFFGRQFWNAALEYYYDLPRTDLNLWLFYNIGQVAEKFDLLDETEIRQSIGLGVSLDDGLRFDVARRLDRSESVYTIHIRLGFKI